MYVVISTAKGKRNCVKVGLYIVAIKLILLIMFQPHETSYMKKFEKMKYNTYIIPLISNNERTIQLNRQTSRFNYMQSYFFLFGEFTCKVNLM